MKYLSVCSGIEAASAAWHPLGWEPEAFAEIEAFPSAVLAHRYPGVPNIGDMTKFKEWNLGSIDLLVGGTPCQSFSVAGLRKGLDDPRGNLMLTYGAIADHFKPRWIVWENVPGVLSSNRGRDFGTFLGMLEELGYGVAYRVLDAQYFGVAQRRRRVFVVGYLGDWRRAAAVLFESESLRGDPAPSREAGQGAPRVAGTLAASGGGTTLPAGNANELDFCVPVSPALTSSGRGVSRTGETRGQDPVVAVMAHGQANAEIRTDGGTPALTCLHEAPVVAFNARQDPDSWVGRTGPLDTDGGTQAVAFGGDIARTLQARHDSSPCADRGMDVVAMSSAVRRLTPVECERVQGFPDNYTNIPWRGKTDSPDGHRYKALGNSMAVPVMAWIGRRIAGVEL